MTKTKPLWLTPSKEKTGLTERVVNFVNRKPNTLSVGTKLTWKEFFQIYKLSRLEFTESDYYKKRIAPFKVMEDTKKGQKLMDEIRTAISASPDAASFFRDIIPVYFAVQLCDKFWHYVRLWENAKGKREQRMILDGIKNVFPVFNNCEDSLENYYRITKDFPEDRAIVLALIGQLIPKNVRDAYRLLKKPEIVLPDLYYARLCQEIKSKKDTGEHFGIREMLNIFRKAQNTAALDLVLDCIENGDDDHEWGRALDYIEEELREADEGDEEAVKMKYLPIVHCGVKKYKLKEGNSLINTVLELLPKYDKTNPMIEEILQVVEAYYGNSEYRMLSGDFSGWYSYAPRPAFVDLYIDSLIRYGVNFFNGALKVYGICQSKKVINAAIDTGIPSLEHVHSDLPGFMEWLKTTDRKWYVRAKKIITTQKLLERWWKEIQKDKDQIHLQQYVTLLKHFEKA